ncbi:MAG: hypothetical protein C0606_02060 [Hyphomicrobiales bacterium]|nr:MAG: hypothetical protein C0606_02060 [Hyphomicrobiales bacterium]
MIAIAGTADSDVLAGTAGSNVIDGLAGDDTITTSLGKDTVAGGAGHDTLVVDWSDALDSVVFWNSQGYVRDGLGGLSEASRSVETRDVESFDIITGAGNDIIRTGAYSDTVDGGEGFDMVQFAGLRSDYRIDVSGDEITVENIASGAVDVISHVEAFAFDDAFQMVGEVALEAPTDLSLDVTEIAENAPAGTRVATVSVTDHNASDSHAFVLVDDAGGTFAIDADGVITVADNALLDFEANPALDITIEVTDSGGLTYTETVTITVTDVIGEVLVGSSGADTLNGGAGADTIAGVGGNDVIDGGDNDDLLNGGNGDDTLYGGAGDDMLVGGAGSDILIGGERTDTAVFSGNRADYRVQRLADGYAIEHVASGAVDTVTGVEELAFDDGTWLAADSLNDAPYDLLLDDATVNENSAAGTKIGTITVRDPDVGDAHSFSLIDDAGGAFAINASGVVTVANPRLLDYETVRTLNIVVKVTDDGGLSYTKKFGIAINDIVGEALSGSAADERLYGSAGSDTIIGGGGADYVCSGSDADTLKGGGGNDTLVGGGGADVLDGATGADLLLGGNHNDVLRGGAGNDTLGGHSGNDKLFGFNGNDVLFGGSGADWMAGGGHNDVLKGGAGNDTLRGDTGNDRLFGEGGADMFVFDDGFGRDRIMDFRDGVDTINLRPYAGLRKFSDLTIRENKAGDAVVDLGSDEITLVGVDKADLDASDFLI